MNDQTVYDLTARTPSGRIIELKFYTPDGESNDPVRTSVNPTMAYGLATLVERKIQKEFNEAISQTVPVDKGYLDPVLSDLASWGIYPVGTVVSAEQISRHIAGHVVNVTQVATVARMDTLNYPEYADLILVDPSVLAHELAHLAAVGEATQWSILIAQDTNPMFIRAIECDASGWVRQPFKVKRDENNCWQSDLDPACERGWFFEEAMAEIVELHWHWSNDRKNFSEPTVYQVGDRIFDIPIEYGNSVAGWAMIMLEKRCPGLVETLLDGARNNVNYDRLKSVLDQASPTLFEKLYRINHAVSLVHGAALAIDYF